MQSDDDFDQDITQGLRPEDQESFDLSSRTLTSADIDDRVQDPDYAEWLRGCLVPSDSPHNDEDDYDQQDEEYVFSESSVAEVDEYRFDRSTVISRVFFLFVTISTCILQDVRYVACTKTFYQQAQLRSLHLFAVQSANVDHHLLHQS